MQHARRSAEATKNGAVVPWWLRSKQTHFSFPDGATKRRIPGIPERLQRLYVSVFGVPALLTPDASDRAAVHPEAARNGREGRNHG